MNLKYAIKYISEPAAIVTALIVILIAVAVLQYIIPGIILSLIPFESEPVTICRLETDDPNQTEDRQKQWHISEARKEFLPDGTIHLTEEVWDNEEGESVIKVFDTNSNILWSGKEKDLQKKYKYLSWPTILDVMEKDVTAMLTRRLTSPVFSLAMIVPVVPSEGKVTELWRYEPIGHYFIGFDSEGKKIGYAGSNGITKSRKQVGPFGEFVGISAWRPRDSYSPVLLWQTKHQLHQINFLKRSIDCVFDAQDKEIDYVAMVNLWEIKGGYYYNVEASDYRPYIYIHTKGKENFLLLGDPNEQLNFKTPQDWTDEHIYITATKEGVFLMYGGGAEGPPEPEHPILKERWMKEHQFRPFKEWVELYKIDGTGDLKLIKHFEWTNPGRSYSREGLFNEGFLRIRSYLKLVSSPLLDSAWHWYYENMASPEQKGGANEMLVAGIIGDDWHFTTNRAWNCIVSLLMIYIVSLHAWSRRTAGWRFILWLIFVGAFNLAGLLTYLALNHTAIIKCPSCGKQRGLERVDCVHCGAELPQPKRRKLDLIFDT